MDQRSLGTIIPEQYRIHLQPDLTTFTFFGEETIRIVVKETTKKITLHGAELTVLSAVIKDSNESNEQTASISYDKEQEQIHFEFHDEITSGEKEFHIKFSGVINEKLRGWYRSAYEVNGEKKYMATSHFEEIGARRVFPSIDDPSAKAVFTISVTIPKNLIAISNTLPASITAKGDLKTVQFEPTPKMSTYPLAIIVGEFESIEKKAENGVLVRVFVTPGKLHQAHFALQTASKMIVYYENYFDIPYPLPKLDFIAVPDFNAGAMENWGAVTAREAALLIDEQKSAAVTKQRVATVIAHEISHMWFGDLVTLEWWTYLWLNEGFASYMEYLAQDEYFPEWHVWEQFAILAHNPALALDALEYTHPVETEVKDIKKAAENFDEISYAKGASIIYMLAAFLGEKIFQEGVRLYLKKHAYGNATTEDLWKSLEEASGRPVRKIMHAFVKDVGHPVIAVHQENNSLLLTQKRFFISQLSAKKSKGTVMWHIPFAISSSSKTYEKEYLMEDKTMSIPSLNDNEWVKINTDETSFVRAIYDEDLYKRLGPAIKGRLLSSIDRTGIVRDAFDAAEEGYFSTVFALELMKSYEDEDAYIVWATLAGKVGRVANLLAETEIYDEFTMYARQIFQKIAQRLGWEKKSSDTHQDILLRSIALYYLGTYGDTKTIEKAQKLFTDFITKGVPIDNDIRGIVYRLVAENGGDKEFEELEKLYIDEELHEEKNRIGSALVSFKNPVLMRKALDFSLSTYVRPQDIGRFILFGFDNDKGRDVTWEFVKENWEFLEKIHEGQIGMDWLIEGAANFVSEEKRKDIEEFFATHITPQLMRTISQVLEHIESNVLWLQRDKEKLASYLQTS